MTGIEDMSVEKVMDDLLAALKEIAHEIHLVKDQLEFVNDSLDRIADKMDPRPDYD